MAEKPGYLPNLGAFWARFYDGQLPVVLECSSIGKLLHCDKATRKFSFQSHFVISQCQRAQKYTENDQKQIRCTCDDVASLATLWH